MLNSSRSRWHLYHPKKNKRGVTDTFQGVPKEYAAVSAKVEEQLEAQTEKQLGLPAGQLLDPSYIVTKGPTSSKSFYDVDAEWYNPPRDYKLSAELLQVVSDPRTDLWQRTYYGFRMDNVPSWLWSQAGPFTYSIQCQFEYKEMFDQCGILVYLDLNNWFKAGIEMGSNGKLSLSCTVTNFGHSDVSSIPFPDLSEVALRLSRRGADFLFEYSEDAVNYKEFRIFHLHLLGVTTQESASKPVVFSNCTPIPLGVYVSSPLDSEFTCSFSQLQIGKPLWTASPY